MPSLLLFTSVNLALLVLLFFIYFLTKAAVRRGLNVSSGATFMLVVCATFAVLFIANIVVASLLLIR